jgi:hypothetical protein
MQDEEIRGLTREIELLGQDKITITKLAGLLVVCFLIVSCDCFCLAAENAMQRSKLVLQESRLEELTADNDAFELTIEEMGKANESLDAEARRAADLSKRLQQQLNTALTKTTQQTAAIAQAIAAMSTPASAATAAALATGFCGFFALCRGSSGCCCQIC